MRGINNVIVTGARLYSVPKLLARNAHFSKCCPVPRM